MPDIEEIRKAKEKKQEEELEKNCVFKYFDVEYPNKYNEVYSKLPGEGGVYNNININLYNYACNSPIKYIDPTGEKVYTVSLGAEIYVALGGNIEVSLVWDDKGNWGLAFTVSVGCGVKVGIPIKVGNLLLKAIKTIVTNGGVGVDNNLETIFDLNGFDSGIEGSMFVGFEIDFKGNLKSISIGAVGGNIKGSATLVIPLNSKLLENNKDHNSDGDVNSDALPIFFKIEEKKK